MNAADEIERKLANIRDVKELVNEIEKESGRVAVIHRLHDGFFVIFHREGSDEK